MRGDQMVDTKTGETSFCVHKDGRLMGPYPGTFVGLGRP